MQLKGFSGHRNTVGSAVLTRGACSYGGNSSGCCLCSVLAGAQPAGCRHGRCSRLVRILLRHGNLEVALEEISPFVAALGGQSANDEEILVGNRQAAFIRTFLALGMPGSRSLIGSPVKTGFFICSEAIFTISGSGETGVFP